MICQWWGDFWISWGDFIFHVVPCSGLTSCQKRCERSSTRTFLPCPVLSFSSFPPFLRPPNPPPLAQTLGVFLFLPCALLLQFSRCCGFGAACPSACQGLGFLCAFFPPFRFLPLFCLRVVCSPACFLPLLQSTGKRGPEMRPEAEKPDTSREAEKPRSREGRHKPRSREAEKPPDKPRSREATGPAEKPRSREATGHGEKPRSREAEEPPGKPRSREAEEPPGKPRSHRSRRASREAKKPPDKPRSREATGHAEKLRSREATGQAETVALAPPPNTMLHLHQHKTSTPQPPLNNMLHLETSAPPPPLNICCIFENQPSDPL